MKLWMVFSSVDSEISQKETFLTEFYFLYDWFNLRFQYRSKIIILLPVTDYREKR